LTSTSYVIQ